MDRRRGQEEIVGFVAIILIVSVIFLIVLGIYLRNPGSEQPRRSGEVYQFLGSSMQTTTDCSITFSPNYLTVGDLLQRCYQDSDERTITRCDSGDSVCKALNETLTDIFDVSWTVGPEASVKGYVFKSVYSVNASESTGLNFVFLKKGSCEFNKIGAEYLVNAYPGSLINTLELCYG